MHCGCGQLRRRGCVKPQVGIIRSSLQLHVRLDSRGKSLTFSMDIHLNTLTRMTVKPLLIGTRLCIAVAGNYAEGVVLSHMVSRLIIPQPLRRSCPQPQCIIVFLSTKA
jgi:hypothetical protein